VKPLLICDCDEVLLHMVRHFGTWVGEAHGIEFALTGGDFASSMARRDGSRPSLEEMWGYIGEFFPDQMHRQTLVPHADRALAHLAEQADIVILTNLGDHCRAPRERQLARFGIEHRVETNMGGKGAPVAKLVAEHGASVTVFVDDLATHHESVMREAPGVWRLQVVSEPELARHVPPAEHAHARIDDWQKAEAWIAARFAEGRAADA
jgi:hypothetical protein